ncbi:MAG: 6-hydroxymethylpterin diphosphokinase MptE-like protein [Candidatus Nezhaarchaeales archaeon]
MDWSLWEPWYLWIASTLSLSISMDYEAAQKLDLMIRDSASKADVIEKIVRNQLVVIVGAGPSLEKSINTALEKSLGVIVAADGACSKLLEVGVVPHVVVTDLDGNIDDIYECWCKGSYVVVHAHGDNIPALEKHVQKFTNKIIGTTQTKPIGCLYNFGGFTDGDRAVFMALELGCKAILMIGMDLSRKVGKYSKPWLKNDEDVWPFKRAKFNIARRLLSWASRLYSKPIVRVTIDGYDYGKPIGIIRDINIKDVDKWIKEVEKVISS